MSTYILLLEIDKLPKIDIKRKSIYILKKGAVHNFCFGFLIKKIERIFLDTCRTNFYTICHCETTTLLLLLV